jgi:glutathione S-transferase
MITVYGYSVSGNCHKLRLLLEQIGHEYRWVEVDSSQGGTRTPEYLAKNANGKVARKTIQAPYWADRARRVN